MKTTSIGVMLLSPWRAGGTVGLAGLLRQFILTLFGEPDLSDGGEAEGPGDRCHGGLAVDAERRAYVALIQEDQCVCFWIHVNDQVDADVVAHLTFKANEAFEKSWRFCVVHDQSWLRLMISIRLWLTSSHFLPVLDLKKLCSLPSGPEPWDR